MIIGKWDPSNWQSLAYSAVQSVPTSGPYRIRVAKGSNLDCKLVGSVQPPAQTSDSTHPTGGVGIFTYRAKACFDYLLVIKAP